MRYMAKTNIENSICDAIELLVDKSVEEAGYDKTIIAEIVECLDPTIGKYKVKYQDADFTAFSLDIDTIYSKGQSVLIKIPQNDKSNDKIILGLNSSRSALDYVDLDLEESTFDGLGYNGIIGDNIFELSSYVTTEHMTIYDADDASKCQVQLDVPMIEENIMRSSAIQLSATVRTALPPEQQFNGHYGIRFVLEFKTNDNEDIIERNYDLDDIHFSGQPYRLVLASAQKYAYEIDAINFIRVKEIYLFCYNFPNQADDKPADIFISNLGFTSGDIVNAMASSLTKIMITPATPSFTVNDLEDTEVQATAQVYIKGRPINPTSQVLEYYWFKEDASVTSNSKNYCEYGGDGWKCLNQASDVSETANLWVPALNTWTFVKAENPVYLNKYKCVAVYKGYAIVKEFNVINYAADITLEIVSDSGTQFYFDIGSPNLTCLVNGEDDLEGYEYKWLCENKDGIVTHYENAPAEGAAYYQAIEDRDALQERVDNNEVLAGAAQSQLDIYQNIVDNYNEDMRIYNNHIFNVDIKQINDYSIYKCSVKTTSGNDLGTAAITLNNEYSLEGNYRLLIKNKTQLFKYDEWGIAPVFDEEGREKTFETQELSFELYDNLGSLIPEDVIERKCNVTWIVPATNTLLSIPSKYSSYLVKVENGMKYYSGLQKISFDVANQYDIAKSNNTIQLDVEYKKVILSDTTNFSFLKEGEPGTNGTDFVAKIVANTEEGSESPIIVNGNLNYEPDNENYWFKAQLWKNGECIFTGYRNGISTDAKPVTVTWKNLKNTLDNTDISINSTGYCRYLGYHPSNIPANIIGCEITYDGNTYYGSLPIPSAEISGNRELKLVKNSGCKFIIYTSDGTNPQWDCTRPFELKVLQLIDGINEDITKIVNEYQLTYNWATQGRVYTVDANTYFDTHNLTAVAANYKCQVIPIDKNDGECLNDALTCTIIQDGNQIGSIHIPIHLLLNRYGHSAINGWDGNSVSIDENGNGVILAPQVGAGQKEVDNSFTGVLMGTVREYGKQYQDVGLLGYSHGSRTIFLNSQNGSAIFGKSNSGQIIIDPTANAAMLYSRDYWKTYVTDGPNAGLPTSYADSNLNGAGMLIDLTEPKIAFGNGNFKVSSQGHLTAKGGGTIAGWNISDTTLTAGNITLNSNGSMSGGSGDKAWSISQNGDATFKTLYASNKGTIGGWTIDGTKLTGGNTTINSNGNIDCSGGAGWYIHNDGSAKFGNFSVNTNGSITANGGTFNNITVQQGSIQSATLTSCHIGAAQIDSGVLGTARIPNLDASKITTGQLSAARIDVNDIFAQNITATGTITGGTLNGTTVSGGTITGGTINIANGNFYTDASNIYIKGNLKTYGDGGVWCGWHEGLTTVDGWVICRDIDLGFGQYMTMYFNNGIFVGYESGR